MTRINYQSDFTLLVTLTNHEGGTMSPPSDHAWSVHISDDAGTCWRCGFDGSSYEDCAVDGDTIVCYVNNPGYVPGPLSVAFVNDIPNGSFADDVETQVTPATTSIMLVDGPTEGGTEASIDMMLQVIAPRVTAATVTMAGDLSLTFNT